MANALIWNVYNLIRTVPGNVVVMVCCTASLIDGQYQASGNVDQKVPYKDPLDPDFIPFDQLTEAETIAWVQQQLGPEQITAMQKGLQQSIDQQKITTANGVPW